jgi:hypothetical protein
VSKLASSTRATWGLGSSLTVTSVTMPSMPSEPVNSASRSKPGLSGIAAQHQALALDREDVHLEQVVHGQAVLQAVHATGVFGDVAADGAGDLRGRVGA